MKFLQSTWGIILLAIISYLLTMGYLVSSSLKGLFEQEEKVTHDPHAADPDFYYWNFHTHEINLLIEDLRQEKQKLDDREDLLAEMEARIEGEKEELARLKKDIERDRRELSNYMMEVKDEELKNLKTEVAIYSNMEPINVVAIFKELSDDEVVKVLALMKPDAIAPILELMMKEGGDNGQPSAVRAKKLLNKLQKFKVIQSGKGA